VGDNPPYIGIDFGTTYASMAWYNPGYGPPHTGQAEIILNSEGEPKTPSVVYYGEDETLVGKLADNLVEDALEDPAERQDVSQRIIRNIKRELVMPPRIALPGNRFVRPVEVAAEILKKLKLDAEDGVFHTKVPRAIITYPAEFDVIQQQVIERAGRMAGFEEVVLLEEPVAGALAYARSGREVGEHVLVYDLGGGTFDLAVLDNAGDSFHVALEPKGIDKCGGEDFDLALYYYCDEIAREKLGRPISPTGAIDLKFLRECRDRKENLSVRERVTVSSLLPGSRVFKHELDREKFDELISDYVETTIRLTQAIVQEAEDGGHKVDTVVLTGGSSKVLLVKRLLSETLPVPPLSFDKGDFAVALGAAHYAHLLWDMPPRRSKPLVGEEPGGEAEPDAQEILDQYRYKVVETAGPDRTMNRSEVDRLDAFATQLGLDEARAAGVEREVLGKTKEDVLLGRYNEAVKMVWKDEKLNSLEAAWLPTLADELGVDPDQAANAEREIMGATREEAFQPSPEPRTSEEMVNFILGLSLEGHSGDVNAVAFTPNGKFMASGSSDGTVRGWSLRTGESVGTLPGPQDRVTCVSFSPDGRFLAAGGLDKTIRVWKLPKGEPLHAFKHMDWVWSIAVSPSGQILASGGADKKIKLWSLETDELLNTLDGHSHWVMALAMGADGRALASGGADGTARLWETSTGRLLSTFEHTAWVRSVSTSRDGRNIAGGCEDGVIKVWGEASLTIDAHVGPVMSVAMSTDEELLFSGGADGRIKVWSLSTGELLNVLPGHPRGIGSVAISPDGFLGSGGADRVVKVWRRQQAPEPRPAIDIPQDPSS
jgi:WD40 repeat protein/actin-like ATPase involved in cell morphogenesis